MFSNCRKSGKEVHRHASWACHIIVNFIVVMWCAHGWTEGPIQKLRVCADPSNLPFSNDHLDGFENKIAQLIAHDMNVSVEYTWLSQRGSFIRKTLEAHKCDVLMTVPDGLKLVLSTKPYYRSTYVFVYANKGLDLHSFDDPVLRKIKIGIHAFGEEGTSPAAIALSTRGIVDGIVGFTILDSEDSPKGKIIDAVAAGQIDVAVVWGPFGGYFAKHQPIELEVVPVSSGNGPIAIPLAFDISMGVRPGDTTLKKQLEDVLDRRHDEIRNILKGYGVPLVAEPQPVISSTSPQMANSSLNAVPPAN